MGSHPPMRGKAWYDNDTTAHWRITPAHAGKSHKDGIILLWSRDHPRPCGEKQNISSGVGDNSGSPPPMQGKAPFITLNDFNGRITPAHAGKRLSLVTSSRRHWDHPRPCGEKWARARRKPCIQGSPPSMRGKGPAVGRIWRISHIGRITPAHAGKRPSAIASSRPSRDHPRPCGEKYVMPLRSKSDTGSPPPMRGKGFCRVQCGRCVRITPAHAGKSFDPATAATSQGDHPRPCGEK